MVVLASLEHSTMQHATKFVVVTEFSSGLSTVRYFNTLEAAQDAMDLVNHYGVGEAYAILPASAVEKEFGNWDQPEPDISEYLYERGWA